MSGASHMKRGACVHCGVPMPSMHKWWCKGCQLQSRHNHGVCDFCNKDVSEYSGCWEIRRRLDHALAASRVPDHHCPSCKEHANVFQELEVLRLSVHDNHRHLDLICPICGTTVAIDVVLMPPPGEGGVHRGGH